MEWMRVRIDEEGREGKGREGKAKSVKNGGSVQDPAGTECAQKERNFRTKACILDLCTRYISQEQKQGGFVGLSTHSTRWMQEAQEKGRAISATRHKP